ncbi:hypothetical protein Z043_120972, partial [Scleropages formosus]
LKTNSESAVNASQPSAKSLKYVPSSKQAQELHHAIADTPEFIHVTKKSVLQYKVPVRSYFSTDKTPRIHKEVKAGLEKQLEEGERFGATAVVTEMVGYMHQEWKGFARSRKQKRELKEKQVEVNIPEHSLINRVVTRQGSKLGMILRFLEQQHSNDNSDNSVLEDVRQMLSPLHDLTDALSSENFNPGADLLALWTTHMEERPHLLKVARKFMCIPVTSLPSDTECSTSGHILFPQRSRNFVMAWVGVVVQRVWPGPVFQISPLEKVCGCVKDAVWNDCLCRKQPELPILCTYDSKPGVSRPESLHQLCSSRAPVSEQGCGSRASGKGKERNAALVIDDILVP